MIRDVTGSYDGAWYGAAALCLIAAALSISIRRRPSSAGSVLPVAPLPAAAAEAHG